MPSYSLVNFGDMMPSTCTTDRSNTTNDKVKTISGYQAKNILMKKRVEHLKKQMAMEESVPVK